MKTNTRDNKNSTSAHPGLRRRLVPMAFLLGASVVCAPQPLWGQQTVSGITTSGKTGTTLGGGSGNPITVNTTTTSGANAYNDFNKFDVSTGEVVNMYLPGSTNNLINIIRDSRASEINGQVNAIKNSKIGGNLFFANANGIVVGSTGSIHAGSITLLTPTKKFIDDLTDTAKIVASGNSFIDGTVPISESGTITIKGKLYALENAVLKGQTVEINGAQIMTGQAAVDQLKALTNLGGIDAGTGLSVSSDGTVEIVAIDTRDIDTLVSVATSSKAEAKVDVIGSEITSGKITIKADADLTTHVARGDSKASINVDNASTLTAKNGDIMVAATAKSTAEFDLDKVTIAGGTSSVGDVVGELKGKLDDFGLSLDGAYADANAQAAVNVGGTLSAGTGNVAISSDATASTKLGVSDGENLGVAYGRTSAVAQTNILSTAKIAGANVSIKGNVTNTNEVSSKAEPSDDDGSGGGQGGGSSIDVPVAISVAIGSTNSEALVNIAGGAEITATENIVLASDVKDSITVSSQSGTDENGTVALTVALSMGDSTSTVTSAGKLKGKDISATANNETADNSTSAEAGVKIETTKKEKSFIDKVKDLKNDPTGIFGLFDKKAEDNGVMQDDAVQNNSQ
ncbi:MAG: leukotoxin LktA family filamentous adhesin, partial [Puniceicoccales bacterium]|nr:leukotoxin LktA family filamentous adhesin [Puniceicoccales bacterium]